MKWQVTETVPSKSRITAKLIFLTTRPLPRGQESNMVSLIPTVDEAGLAALLRVIVGGAFIVHGLPKIRGGWRQSSQWLQSMGVPAAGAVLATILEFFGGIFLVIGLIVPVVAGFFAIQMLAIVAMKKSKMHASFVSTTPGKPTYEIDVLYLLLATALVVLGAGALSLDSILGI